MIGGSSPLTRGKPFDGHKLAARVGLIPAHAGKTSRTSVSPAAPRAHPRSRGENRRRLGLPTSRAGSSPLTRGKLRLRRSFSARPGLIPAHAGKTKANTRPTRPNGAHPRSRGENVASPEFSRAPLRSSPLTRGKRASRQTTSEVTGLIPAHAGKTQEEGASVAAPRAHPRSRGENWCFNHAGETMPGSSPLTRGKQAALETVGARRGLIPAHAGKTSKSGASVRPRRAHPRSRGENIQTCVQVAADLGSSPLTRGKRSGRRSRGRA